MAGTRLMPLLGSVGAGEAGVGPPTLLAASGYGAFQDLLYFLFKYPSVGPSYVPHIVPGVATMAVNQWGNHPGHSLWHFILRARRLVVGVWFDAQGFLVSLVGVALLQRDPNISLLFSTSLYV